MTFAYKEGTQQARMLDDLKMIHQRDTQDALGIAERQWRQLDEVFEVSSYEGYHPENIVYCGMGGSALAAVLSTTWPRYNVPFELVRGYDIPFYVSDKTLFIASSYSGNTEETLNALKEAEARGAKIVIISDGGALKAHAAEKGYPLASVTRERQPRYAVLGELRALVALLQPYGLFIADDLDAEFKSASDFLKGTVGNWAVNVPTSSNAAKQLAQELIGQSVVIYAGPNLFPAAYKWKIDFNENAKQLAWTDAYPEFSHNEFLGWTKQPVKKPYAIVELRSDLERNRIQKRFMVTQKLLSGLRPVPHVVNVRGKTLLQQLVWAVTLGDFVSLYTAVLSGINPGPVELLEKYKKEMNKE